VPNVRVLQTERAKARGYFAKAEQFCEAARQQLELAHHDAAVLLAVHAGINSTDAACVALAGRRSVDPNHLRAADLLESVGRNIAEFREQADRLRVLIGQKNRIEYEDARATQKEALDAVKRCERLVAWTREELAEARPH